MTPMTMIVCISGYLRNISFFFCSINILDTMVPKLIWALENCHFTDAQCFVVLIIFGLIDVRLVTSIGDQIANMNRPICLFTFLKSCIKLKNLQSANWDFDTMKIKRKAQRKGSIEFTNPTIKFSLRLSKSSYHLLAVQPCVKIQFVLLDFEMLEKVAAIEVSM